MGGCFSTFAFKRLFPLNKTGLLVELGFNLIGTVLVMHKAQSWALGWFLVLYIPCMVTHTCNSSTLKDGSRMIQKFEGVLGSPEEHVTLSEEGEGVGSFLMYPSLLSPRIVDRYHEGSSVDSLFIYFDSLFIYCTDL